MQVKQWIAEPLLKLNQPNNQMIANDLIDIHNALRCGKPDNARIILEVLLGNTTLNWKDVVNFPKTPKM